MSASSAFEADLLLLFPVGISIFNVYHAKPPGWIIMDRTSPPPHGRSDVARHPLGPRTREAAATGLLRTTAAQRAQESGGSSVGRRCGESKPVEGGDGRVPGLKAENKTRSPTGVEVAFLVEVTHLVFYIQVPCVRGETPSHVPREVKISTTCQGLLQ